MPPRIKYALLCLGLSIGTSVLADDWPMFGRDQSRNAVSPERNPPTFWQIENPDDPKDARKNKNILWKSRIGDGTSYYGSLADPVIVNGQIWIGSNSTIKDKNYYAFSCLEEKSGKLLYRYLTPALGYGERFLHTMASSLLIEGDRMWFFTNRMEVVCLDIAPLRKGKGEPRELWKVDLQKSLGVHRAKSIFDCRLCSIAAHGDRIYVITGNGVNWENDGKVNADAPSLICFNRNTGKIVWQDNSPGKDIMHSQFASPTIIAVSGKTQVVAPQGDGWVRSFDAATGKLIWKFDTNPPDTTWNQRWKSTRNYLPATAVFHDGRLCIGNGQEPEAGGGPAWLYCIDPSKTGDISPHLPDGPGKGKPNPNSGMVWKYGGVEEKTKRRIFSRTLSNVSIKNGLLVAGDIDGKVHCLDARSGQRYWVHDTDGEIHGSPLIVDNRVYVGNTAGTMCIFELAKQKRVVAQIDMDRLIRASPVLASGVLYVATGHWLYAIAEGGKRALE